MDSEDGVSHGYAHLVTCLPRETMLCDASLLLSPPEFRPATFDLRPAIGAAFQTLAMVIGFALGVGFGAGYNPNPNTICDTLVGRFQLLNISETECSTDPQAYR